MSCAERELEALRRGIGRCRRCRLDETRTRAVPGEGPAGARLVFVGEAPGETEDARGLPFCGRAGAFLDEMLALAGIGRKSVFVTSAVKCRPPDNRTPRADELETCREAWLERQIAAMDPGLVVLLGRTPIRQMLGESRPLRAVGGSYREAGGRHFLLTYHPAAGMRFPEAEKRMRADFEALGARRAPPLTPPRAGRPPPP